MNKTAVAFTSLDFFTSVRTDEAAAHTSPAPHPSLFFTHFSTFSVSSPPPLFF